MAVVTARREAISDSEEHEEWVHSWSTSVWDTKTKTEKIEIPSGSRDLTFDASNRILRMVIESEEIFFRLLDGKEIHRRPHRDVEPQFIQTALDVSEAGPLEGLSFPGGPTVAFGPRSDWFVYAKDDAVVHHGVSLSGLETEFHHPEGESRSGSVTSVAVDPKGRLVASAHLLRSTDVDAYVRLWDARRQELLVTLRPYAEHLKFSPDGLTLAGLGPRNNVVVWDLSFEALNDAARRVANRCLSPSEVRSYRRN